MTATYGLLPTLSLSFLSCSSTHSHLPPLLLSFSPSLSLSLFLISPAISPPVISPWGPSGASQESEEERQEEIEEPRWIPMGDDKGN